MEVKERRVKCEAEAAQENHHSDEKNDQIETMVRKTIGTSTHPSIGTNSRTTILRSCTDSGERGFSVKDVRGEWPRKLVSQTLRCVPGDQAGDSILQFA